jgi:LysM repeat protein
VWRPVGALVVTILVSTVAAPAGAAGKAGAAAPPKTVHLSIDARTGSLDTALVPSSATLACDGDGTRGTGFLAHASRSACALVRSGAATKVAAANRRARLCPAVYGGPQLARLTGRIGARRISFSVDRADGCGIAEWDVLRALLGDPERNGAIPRLARSTATTTTPPDIYVVRRGDTLTGIARQFHTSIGAIVATNRLTDPDHLAEGQQLQMPPPSAVRIDATLDDASPTPVVHLALVGANPDELVTFVITLADGSTYTGSPHVASPSGAVTTSYTGTLGSGPFTVTADGDHGTTVTAAFRLRPAG